MINETIPEGHKRSIIEIPLILLPPISHPQLSAVRLITRQNIKTKLIKMIVCHNFLSKN